MKMLAAMRASFLDKMLLNEFWLNEKAKCLIKTIIRVIL